MVVFVVAITVSLVLKHSARFRFFALVLARLAADVLEFGPFNLCETRDLVFASETETRDECFVKVGAIAVDTVRTE